MGNYNILSIDGGGIRGLISIIFLQRLNQHPKCAGFLQRTHLFAGTSTGGLVALGLAAELDTQQMRELYEHRGPQIFDDSWLDNLTDLGRTIGAEYDNRSLERELRRLFGDKTLGDLPRRVLLTAFDLDNEEKPPRPRNWKPKILHNYPGDPDNAVLVYKAGLYTTAAPTYFPSVDGFVDGGVYANNPSMCALAQALDSRYRVETDLNHIHVFSLGTGKVPKYIPGKRLNWGNAQWVRPLIDLMLDGVAGIADYQCRQLLGDDRYHRLSPDFPSGQAFQLDDIARIPEMARFALFFNLEASAEWLGQHWTA